MAVPCGNKVHRELNAAAQAHHDSVAQAKLCFRRPIRSIEEMEADLIAEAENAAEDHAMEAFAGI